MELTSVPSTRRAQGGPQRGLRSSLLYLSSFAIPFALLLHSSAPAVTTGDSGELLAAASCLGVPHPPGYPLWILVDRAAMLIPAGSLGMRGAVASGLCASLACGLVCIAAARLLGSRAAGAASGIALACSRTLWEQASIAEVYSLNVLAGASLLAVWVWGGRPARRLPIMALLLGLGLSNHHTVAPSAAALGVASLIELRRTGSFSRTFLLGASLGILGLAGYLTTAIRSQAGPPMNGLHPHPDPLPSREREFVPLSLTLPHEVGGDGG